MAGFSPLLLGHPLEALQLALVALFSRVPWIVGPKVLDLLSEVVLCNF
jgi:hypothetical protein